jgi:hypothetical protein
VPGVPLPSARRAQRQPTDDRQQLRLLVTAAEQETYELLRPIVRFGRSSADRARETGVPPLDEVEWHPAQRLPPYRPRRTRAGDERQERPFDVEPATTSG